MFDFLSDGIFIYERTLFLCVFSKRFRLHVYSEVLSSIRTYTGCPNAEKKSLIRTFEGCIRKIGYVLHIYLNWLSKYKITIFNIDVKKKIEDI